MPRNIVVRWVVAIFMGLPVWGQTSVPVAPGTEAREKEKETASIEGRVVRAADGSPLKKATVMAIRMQSPQLGLKKGTATVTDANGKFILKDLGAGRYTLSAKRNGYVRQEYGDRSLSGHGTTIAIVAGQRLNDVLFRMVAEGVISGKVVDEDGEPIRDAEVEAQRWSFVEGKRQLIAEVYTRSNDLGEYRLAQLEPGRYLVSISFMAEDYVMEPGSKADTHEGYTRTFYPGAYDPSQATPIEIRAGEEVSGIGLRMVPAHAVKVRGIVVGAKSMGSSVILMAKGSGRFGPQKFSRIDDKGEFEIMGVLPGSYTVVATSFADEKRSSARQAIEVGDADVEGITLTLAPGMEVAGRVRLEGNVGVQDARIRLSLSNDNEGSSISYGMPAEIDEDLSFSLKGIAEGDYRLRTWGLPENAYVKGATSGTQNVLEDGFHVAGAPKPLEIVISANGGRVEGAVTDAKDRAFTGARVVLVPEESRRSRTDLFKAANTDQYGHYSIHGVAPGTYTIYAWETVEEGAYQDPDFLKQYVDMGKAVKVTESSQMSMDLKVIAAQAEEGN